ncbi:hypothetical protein TWF718_007984 [Orbilia javanica]|uniref:Up-regulated during septation protein 1 domain-containing protein n=1 Tax=Orbilia javanica TaxID=47235 RepID=A0AAN8N0B4_9PEZI
MAELKGSTQTLDFDDEIALHLLVETAIFDSSGYELLTHEELDRLKREQTTLIGRIEALRRKLLLETKVRDAAQSLSRLRSPKQNESPLTSPVSASGSSFSRPGHDSMTQASAELSASIAKCHEIDTDIRKLEADLWVLERRLLCHTSRVLATTYYHTEKSRHYSAGNIETKTVRSSIPNKFAKYQSVKTLEDFDDRSLYKPANDDGGTLPSHPEFHPSDPTAYPEISAAQSYNSVDSDRRPSPANVDTTNLPSPLHHRDQFLGGQRLAALNGVVKTMLVQIETLTPGQYNVSQSTVLEENKDQDSNQINGVPNSMFDEVVALERGLGQVQEFVFRQSNDPAANKSDDSTILPVWGVLLDWEKRIREVEQEQGDNKAVEIKTGVAREVDQSDDTGFKVLENGSRSIGELVERVKSFTNISLRWAAERRELQRQLLQKSQENQMEIQKHENTKTDHEQQIHGLTNSLSNALSELSQVSSKQDANALLKQESAKLREELDAREQHYTNQIAELQLVLSSQKSDFEKRINDAQTISREREHDLEEELQILREEIGTKNRALEDSLAVAGTGDQKARELKDKIDYLHVQLEESHAAKTDRENQSILDRQNLDSLTETLRAREARVETLERNLAEITSSKGELEKMYNEQTKHIEVLDERASDLQHRLQGKDAQVAEQMSSAEELKSRLIESQAAKKNLESNVSTLENEVQQLLTELATLATNSQQQIEDAKQQAAAKIQVEQGRSQPAMDTGLIVELENLSKQNEELRKANFALQGKLSEPTVQQRSLSTVESQGLHERCEKLQKELDEMLVDYESLVKDSVDFEADKSRLESQIDVLQDKVETLERSLADERMGNGRPGKPAAVSANSLVTPLPSSGENMTMSVLRAEFKKMMRDMRTEHSRALRGEQEARRRLENELRHVRRDQSNGASSKPVP